MFRTLGIKLYNWLFPVDSASLIAAYNRTLEEEKNVTANIIPTTDGKFALYVPKTGEQVGTYSRARDARRGAQRKGLVLA